jgi:lactoylglutathione lyase
MKIEHVALWTHDLERLKDFYVLYFGAQSNDKYMNTKKGFESYFLSFDSGARLEIMQMPSIPASLDDREQQFTGYIHIAVAVGGRETVDTLTEQLRQDGYRVVGEPRTTGDGYYESVVLDPDGNRIEITI